LETDWCFDWSYPFFSARHIVFIYIMLFTSQTMLGKGKRLIESQRLELDPNV